METTSLPGAAQQEPSDRGPEARPRGLRQFNAPIPSSGHHCPNSADTGPNKTGLPLEVPPYSLER